MVDLAKIRKAADLLDQGSPKKGLIPDDLDRSAAKLLRSVVLTHKMGYCGCLQQAGEMDARCRSADLMADRVLDDEDF